MLTLLHGDALTKLAEIESESVQCVVTSPPYWGLRDYGVEGQLGLEKTPEEYVGKLVEIFREVRRVLRKDGTCWLNLGDSYAGSWGAQSRPNGNDIKSTLQGGSMLSARQIEAHPRGQTHTGSVKNTPGIKPKDLVGIPWMVAFALRADGWYLRSDIIWSKPNPMPESVTDRPTKAHEYIFLLSKSQKYYYDAEAIKERATHAGKVINLGEKSMSRGQAAGRGIEPSGNGKAEQYTVVDGRNRRSVWNVTTSPFPDAHFATFPTEIPRTCILAGSKAGDVVLDPFAGSGTTGKVAIELGRRAVLIEPKDEYVEMIERRCKTTIGLPLAI